MMYQPVEEDAAYRLDRATTRERTGDSSLWDRILRLIEQDLEERRNRRLFVEAQGESGPCRKEIGELSASERQDLPPALKEDVAEWLLDRYLAERGRVDLADSRRAYTKQVRELVPEDLPALIEADRQRAEEEDRKEREKAGFVREAQADLERLLLVAARLAETPGRARR